MLYSILFATLLHSIKGQINLADNTCSSSDATKCTNLQTTYGGLLGSFIPELAGETIVCGESMGYCTVTCVAGATDADRQAACAKLSSLGINGATCVDEGNGNQCILTLDCTENSDCYTKFADNLPRCDNPSGEDGAGTCKEGTPRPTPMPTTGPPVTKQPTDAPTTIEEGYAACLARCTGATAKPMWCEANQDYANGAFTLKIDCDNVDSKCEAQCLVDYHYALNTEGLSSDMMNVVTALTPDDPVKDFCGLGTCDNRITTTTTTTTTTTEEPTTTETPKSTETPTTTLACDQDPYVFQNDCPDDDPFDGCQVQFNVTLDFCIVNRKFRRRQIRRFAKLAYEYAMDTVANYDCVEADMAVTRFVADVNGKDDDVKKENRRRSRRKPIRKRDGDDDDCGSASGVYDPFDPDNVCCEDLDDICGVNRDNKRYRLAIDTQFQCGTCAEMKSVVTTITNFLDSFDAAFIIQCLGLSDGSLIDQDLIDVGLEGDNLCATGLGKVAMEVQNASLAYINADGEVEVEISTSNNDVNGIKYGFALIVAFIMAAIY